MTRPRLVLGSASPRRAEILRQIGLPPDDIRPPEIDETPGKGELPTAYVMRMALEKIAVLEPRVGEVVLCADTTVAVGRRILGKPEGEDEARAFLDLLGGRRHQVHTAVTVRDADGVKSRLVTSMVKFKRLSETEIAGYLASDDWKGKAGGYAIQGYAGSFIKNMTGSYSNVVGLSLYDTMQMLKSAGFFKS